MPERYGSAHWLVRAEEARLLAQKMADGAAKRSMEKIAAEYEKLARRAEERIRQQSAKKAP